LVSFSRSILAASIASALLLGCATQGETGTAVGALIGAVVGKAVGGDRGMILGAAIGGGIGYNIGKNMDEADRKKLAETRAMAAQANAKQSFYSSSAKANVVVEPSQSYASPKKQQLVFDKDVQVVPITVMVASADNAYVDTPIYSSPDYSRSPKLLVMKGSQIRRIAIVDGTDWYAVGQDDYGLGYVHKDYFDQKIVAATDAAVRKISKKPTVSKATVAKSTKVEPNSTGSGSSMLDSTAVNLPPTEHFSTAKTTASDFAATSSAGASKAEAIKQGNKAYLTQTKLVGASAQCRDLVTTLLQDNKAVGTEKSTSCSTTKGWI
jgi:surface antigen